MSRVNPHGKSGAARGIAAILPIIVLLAAGSAAGQAAPEYVILAHRDAGITDLTAAELSRVFLVQTVEVSGKPTKPVNLAGEDDKFGFLQLLTGMSRRDIEKHFVAQELRGEGGWPVEAQDGDALVKLMLQSKKVIGWLPTADYRALPERVSSVLVIVSIDGKSPAAPGYRLKR